MANLNLKDLSFNWKAPVVNYKRKGSSIPEDFITLKRIRIGIHKTKYSVSQLIFRTDAIKHFFKDQENLDNLKLSVSFEEDNKLIFVFDPVDGVPYYKLKNHKGNQWVIPNTDLIDDIYKHLKLSPEQRMYFLKGFSVGVFNKMHPYVMTPQHYDSKLPVFEDELYNR